MRTFREVIHQMRDAYGMFEYKVAEERILLDVLETLYTRRDSDPDYIALIRELLEHVIAKDSITKKITHTKGSINFETKSGGIGGKMKEIVKFTIMDRDEVLKAIARGEIADMDWNTPNYKREHVETTKTKEELEAELVDNIIYSRKYGEVKKVSYSNE